MAKVGHLQSPFIDRLVPWGDFVSHPNRGHAAVADFLLTKVAGACLSSNYDILIERQANEYGADFEVALDGDEANAISPRCGPLLKFHGCSSRDRGNTVWAESQLLTSPVVVQRIANSTTWMNANLRKKDFLVLGFWSDWGYLNTILSDAIQGTDPLSITVVDPNSLVQLQGKAPELWKLANTPPVKFEHVQASAADFLDELRKAFSSNFLRKMLFAGREAASEAVGKPIEPAWEEFGDFGTEELYAFRRDAEGVPSTRPARRKQPGNTEALGCFHLMLRASGATLTASGYKLEKHTVRVINGAEAVMSTLKNQFVEPPVAMEADICVAVGATVLAAPGNVVRSGRPRDIVRPESSATWVDINGARTILGI